MQALQMIDRFADETPDEPFFLWHNYWGPHEPYCPTAEYLDMYRDVSIEPWANFDWPALDTPGPHRFALAPPVMEAGRNLPWESWEAGIRYYYAFTTMIDAQIGRIMEHLRQRNLLDNTVVIFSSDHGMFYGERGLCDCWLLNEEPLRVPLILFDPKAMASRGSTCDEIALNVDIAPTILDLADLPISEGTQGRSLVPLLAGRKAVTDWRSDFFCEHLFDHADIPKSEGVRSERWKYIRYFEQRPAYEELYDLENDPFESENLVDEGEYAEQLQRLRDRCDSLGEEATAG